MTSVLQFRLIILLLGFAVFLICRSLKPAGEEPLSRHPLNASPAAVQER